MVHNLASFGLSFFLFCWGRGGHLHLEISKQKKYRCDKCIRVNTYAYIHTQCCPLSRRFLSPSLPRAPTTMGSAPRWRSQCAPQRRPTPTTTNGIEPTQRHGRGAFELINRSKKCYQLLFDLCHQVPASNVTFSTPQIILFLRVCLPSALSL